MFTNHPPVDYYFSLPFDGREPSRNKARRIQDVGRRTSLNNYWHRRQVGSKLGVRVLRPGEMEILFHYLVSADHLDVVFRRMQAFYHMLLERVGKGLFRYHQLDDGIGVSIDRLWIHKSRNDLSLDTFQSIEPIIYFIQWLIDEPFVFTEIEVPWGRDSAANTLVARHTPSIRHDSARLYFALDRELAQKKVVRKPEEVEAFLNYLPCYLALGYFDSVTSESYLQGFVLRFLSLNQRAPQLTDLGEVFGMSVSSIKRHLAGHGIQFNGVIKRALSQHACSLLLNSNRSIKDIAACLGYRDHNAFRRAFRSWLGVQPQTWRLSAQKTEVAPAGETTVDVGCREGEQLPATLAYAGFESPGPESLYREYRRRTLTNYLARRRAGGSNGCRVMRPYEIGIMHHFLLGAADLQGSLRQLKRFTYLLRERLAPGSLVFRENRDGTAVLDTHYAWKVGSDTSFQDAILENLQSLLYLLQWAADTAIQFDSIHLPWKENAESLRMISPLSASIHFGARSLLVGFSKRQLAIPIVRNSLELPDYYEKLPFYCEYGFQNTNSLKDHALRHIDWLYRHHGSIPELAAVAELANLDVDTLRRGLAEEKCSYRDLIKQYKYQLARSLLRNHRAPVKDVAARLGYDDANSFRRAFKSWSGCQPHSWMHDSRGYVGKK
jgi:AraC-like DNA-binding protein